MKLTRVGSALCLICIGVLSSGCGQSESPETTNHEDSRGDHSQSHTHGSPLSEPLYGGAIVSIGHSHHADGATNYYAEVMPVVNGRITFHILTQNAEDQAESFPSDASEIVAYIDRLDSESAQAYEIVFKAADEGGGATFVATVPEMFLDSADLSVVVPRIRLGGERLNFSFAASQAGDPRDPEQTKAEIEEPSE